MLKSGGIFGQCFVFQDLDGKDFSASSVTQVHLHHLTHRPTTSGDQALLTRPAVGECSVAC